MSPQAIARHCVELVNGRGCPEYATTKSRCAAHAKARFYRGSSTDQGYGADWRRLRAAKLAANPYCQNTPCLELATDVDHITPRSKGGTDDWDNLQSLCHSHHSAKTARENGWG